ncbi:hypothetical protein H4R19_005082, partial [Coemansia spiralis]
MNLLKDTIRGEVAKRKQQYAQAAGRGDGDDAAPRRKKYVRVGDLEDTGRSSSTETAAGAGQAPELSRDSTAPSADDTHDVRPADRGDVADRQAQSSTITADEVVKRLRARGEPIRLFGEGDELRRARLRQLELAEEKTDGQQNEFRRVMAQVEAGAMLEDIRRESNMNDDEAEKRQQKYELLAAYDVSDMSPELLRTDMNRLHTLLYVYFKRLLYEWGDYLAARHEEERRSPEGKMAAATQRQSAEYLKPLFRSLKQRKLEADVVARITEIARNMLDREYMRANDAYLQ